MIDREPSYKIEKMKTQKAPKISLERIHKYYDKLSHVKKIITPNFLKFKSRYTENQKLPSFMQNVNSRLSLVTLSGEMIKSNKYDKLDYYNSGSLFNVMKTNRNDLKIPTLQNFESEKAFKILNNEIDLE